MLRCVSSSLLIYQSPSTRRAWIEIPLYAQTVNRFSSPSTRRAWIEIGPRWLSQPETPVALHPEGVDRNDSVRHLLTLSEGRPPPGGRG